MKTQYVPIALSACLALLPITSASAENVNTPTAVDMNQCQLYDRVSELVDAAVSCMQQIQDEKSADAAPGIMKEILMKFDELEQQLEAAGVELSEELMQKAEEQSLKIESEARRIAAADFYGSEPLEEFCRDKFGAMLEEMEMAKIPAASPEVVQKLVESRRETIERTLTDFDNMLKGGPGFSRETAWQILIPDNFAVRFEYLIMQRMLLMDRRRQALVADAGRYYDCHEIIEEVDGVKYVVQQWFDITPYYLEFSKKFDEEEKSSQ